MPPVTLFVRSLKDGVGRQAPSKRLPTEAQELINTIVTVERSAEKRPGTRAVTCETFTGDEFTTYGDLELPALADDMFHYWFDLTPEKVFLISVNYKGTEGDGNDLFYVHEVTHGRDQETRIRKITSFTGDASIRDYVRKGNDQYEAREALSVLSIGPSLLLLNKFVATGFTSSDDGKTKDLDGNSTTTDDLVGAKETYLSASYTDPQGTALIWVKGRAYAGGQEVYVPGDGATGKVWQANEDIGSTNNSLPPSQNTNKWTNVRTLDRIPVEDFEYPDASKAYLGQSVNDISEINLPPNASDVNDYNGAETMLAAYYPDDLGAGQNNRTNAGTGKIYYFQNGYGGTEPGYYIVRSATEQPYLKKIRTPDAYSVIDDKRMPVVLRPSNGGASWDVEHGEYNERISGDLDSNPGPKAWEEGRQAPITALTSFRNRLWYAIGDTIFSSAINKYGDFFLEDPALIVDTDPCDLLISSNKYTPVRSLTPFESYIFVDTGADTQFVLEGSENQITPYTAALSSQSFYSTSYSTDPLLMGNQVYFFDDKRLYIYMPSSAVAIQRAAEVSKNVPGYLPKDYGAMTVCNAYETMFLADNDNRTDVYCYTNRWQGDQLLQNAFFRMEYPEPVVSMHSYEEDLYFLTKDENHRYSLREQKFRNDSPKEVFLDQQETVEVSSETRVYFTGDNKSEITFPSTVETDNDVCVVGYDSTDPLYIGGTILTVIDVTRSGGNTVVTVQGNIPDGVTLIWGKNYDMVITLSPQYQRDDNNNVIDGNLSLRSLHTRHYNTGNYEIEKTVRGRTSTPTKFSPFELDETLGLDDLPLENSEVTGEAIAKIFGNADETSMSIKSTAPTPVNITQIQLKGIFNEKFSSFNR